MATDNKRWKNRLKNSINKNIKYFGRPVWIIISKVQEFNLKDFTYLASKLSKVECLEFSNVKFSKDLLENFNFLNFPRLKGLHFYNCNVSEDVLKTLKGTEGIESLSLTASKRNNSLKSLDFIDSFPSLYFLLLENFTTLSFNYSGNNTKTLEEIAVISCDYPEDVNLNGISKFTSISFITVIGKGIKGIEDIQFLENLVSLSIEVSDKDSIDWIEPLNVEHLEVIRYQQ